MASSEAFIDANLLVLLVVGRIDRRLVARHRRTRRFSPEDYDRLANEIGRMRRVFVTPNALTEASNLLESPDPRFLEMLRALIEDSREIVVPSAAAVRNEAFARLGLSDAVLLESISAERPLITVDLALYLAAVAAKGDAAALNFIHN